MMTVRFEVNDVELRNVFLRNTVSECLAPLDYTLMPLWGAMTAQQMVEHLTWAFELSTGNAPVECPFDQMQQERFRAFLYDARPMSHNFMNPALVAGVPALRHRSVPEAAASLQIEIGRFLEQCASAPEERHTHPLFGLIGADDWSRVHFKHCFHHLLQFGLISEAPP